LALAENWRDQIDCLNLSLQVLRPVVALGEFLELLEHHELHFAAAGEIGIGLDWTELLRVQDILDG
jgi:hypothetical protein